MKYDVNRKCAEAKDEDCFNNKIKEILFCKLKSDSDHEENINLYVRNSRPTFNVKIQEKLVLAYR